VRVRLGLGGNTTKGQPGYADPTSTAVFTWETTARTTNAKVRIAADPGAIASGQVHAGYVFTAPPPESGFGTSDPPGYLHEVHVCGLTAGTTYYYQVGGGAPGSEIWSATQSFTTVPAATAAGADAAAGKIVVGVFGDARDTVGTWQLVHERMRDAAVNLMLVSGDLVDIGSESSLFQQWLDAVWKDPSDATKFLTLGQVMMVPIAGNHENDSTQFYGNFAIPGAGTDPYAEQYASFDVGNTHFAMVDDQPIAEAPSSAAAAAELQWLDADLAAANADRAHHPFLFVISHRGMFSTSNHADDSDVHQARGSMAPIFDKYHVDVVMNGHDHEYERSLPLTAGNPASGMPNVQTPPAQGTVYIINAGAGADPYQVATYQSAYRNGNPTPLGNLSTKGYVGCYVLLTLEGTKLTLNAYGMKASGGGVSGDDVIDTLTLGQ
jgi:hypothetical protein